MLGPLRADRGDAACQTFEPGVDVVAEDADANQNDNGDSGDQQAVFDDVLSILIAKKLPYGIHVLEPPRESLQLVEVSHGSAAAKRDQSKVVHAETYARCPKIMSGEVSSSRGGIVNAFERPLGFVQFQTIAARR
jgi:hypothetical protein